LLFIELDLVNLSATSLSQSDFRGRWSTTTLHSKKAAIKWAALMSTEALLSPAECLFHIPKTTPKQSTFVITVEFL
jgi:hypothetical protein